MTGSPLLAPGPVAAAREVAALRRDLRGALRDWSPELVDDLLVVVSELVTNAVVHAGGATTVEVRDASVPQAPRTAVEVAVADTSPLAPRRRVLAADASVGRGLGLVDALAAQWRVEPADGGKRVVALVGAPR